MNEKNTIPFMRAKGSLRIWWCSQGGGQGRPAKLPRLAPNCPKLAKLVKFKYAGSSHGAWSNENGPKGDGCPAAKWKIYFIVIFQGTAMQRKNENWWSDHDLKSILAKSVRLADNRRKRALHHRSGLTESFKSIYLFSVLYSHAWKSVSV